LVSSASTLKLPTASYVNLFYVACEADLNISINFFLIIETGRALLTWLFNEIGVPEGGQAMFVTGKLK